MLPKGGGGGAKIVLREMLVGEASSWCISTHYS